MIRYRWRTELKKADTEAEVLDIVRAYLATWTTEDVAALPKGATPPPMNVAKDVTGYTFLLAEVHARFEGSEQSLARLQELLLFFTHASVRATQLRAVGFVPSGRRTALPDDMSGKGDDPFEAPPPEKEMRIRRDEG
jgi:hypothetical protein